MKVAVDFDIDNESGSKEEQSRRGATYALIEADSTMIQENDGSFREGDEEELESETENKGGKEEEEHHSQFASLENQLKAVSCELPKYSGIKNMGSETTVDMESLSKMMKRAKNGRRESSEGSETDEAELFLGLLTTRRLSWLNTLVFFTCVLFSLVIPYLVFKHLLDAPMICFQRDENDEPLAECTDQTMWWGQTLYFCGTTLCVGTFFTFTSKTIVRPLGAARQKVDRMERWIYLYGFAISFMPRGPFLVFSIALPWILGLAIGPLLEPKHYSKSALKFHLFLFFQFVIISYAIRNFGAKLNEEFVADMSCLAFAPILVQLGQGILLAISQRYEITINSHNSDYFILMAKYAMAYSEETKLFD